jgi:hypothetical protein
MSHPEPLATAWILPTAILETILTRLAAIFLAGANNDATLARHAAVQALAAYHPRTETEFRLAATIIAFGFQALEALGQAATADMPLTRILRLRGSAVSLSREANKAQRRLDQLLETSPQPNQPEPQPPEIPPHIEKALDLIEETRTIATTAKASGLTWTQSYEARQRDQRIAASLKRAEARIAAQSSAGAALHSRPDTNQNPRAAT